MESFASDSILNASILTHIFRMAFSSLFIFFIPFRGFTMAARLGFFVIMLFALSPLSLFSGDLVAPFSQQSPLVGHLYFDFNGNGYSLRYCDIATDILRLSLIGICLSTSFFVIQLLNRWLRSIFFNYSHHEYQLFHDFRGFDCLFGLFYLYLIFNVVGVDRIISVFQQLLYFQPIFSSGGEVTSIQKTGIAVLSTVISRSFYLAFILSIPFFLSSIVIDFSYFCFSRFVGSIEVYGIYRIATLCLVSSVIFVLIWMKFIDILIPLLTTRTFF